MWTKLVHVYEARLRCKNHINAEKSRQLGETFSADVFNVKKVPKLGTFIAKMVINLNTIFPSHPVRHMSEMHPNLECIMSNENYSQVGNS